MIKGMNKWMAGAIVVCVAVFLWASMFGRTVEPGNVGVKIRTIGMHPGVDPVALQSGWHLLGIGERIVQFPVIQRTYTYTHEIDERGPENEEVTFSDNTGLPMSADVQVVLQVGANCAPELYTRWRLTFDQLFEGPIRNDVRTAISAESELVSVEQLYSGGRQGVIQRALARVRAKWDGLCVTVSQLDWIGNIRYPDVILEAIQAKTRADQETLAAQARVAKAKAEADAMIEQARGQAESNRLLAQSIAANPLVVQLKAIEKWDGHMPQVVGNGATPLIDLRAQQQ